MNTINSFSKKSFGRLHSMTNEDSLLKLLAYVILFTSSFDIVLNVRISGLNFRFCQLVIITLAFFTAASIFKNNKFVMPVNIKWILIYAFINTLFIVNSVYRRNAIGYDLWLLLNIVTIFIFVNLFTAKSAVIGLLRSYVYSFVFVCFIAFLQYILYNFFNINYHMMAYNRVHAFCFEPSYFATYMLPCWCFLEYIWEKKCTTAFRLREIKICFFILTLALIMSFSRMGIILMFIYLIFRLLVNIRLSLSFSGGRLKAKRKLVKVANLLLIVSIIAVIFVLYMYFFEKAIFLKSIDGLGIFGTNAHSSAARQNTLRRTMEIFFQSPIFGCSLGDLDYRITKNLGIIYNGRTGKTMSIFAEQFAANGIFGGIIFLYYIYKNVFLWKNKELKVLSKDYNYLLRGLCLGLGFQVIILNMNQNVLRVYFWIHLAVIAVLYSSRKYFEN